MKIFHILSKALAALATSLYTGHMNITKKLFLTLLGVATFIVIVNIALARWNFEQGLQKFIGDMELQRLQNLSLIIIDDYETNGSNWLFIKGQDLSEYLELRRNEKGRGARKGPPPPHHRKKGPPPPHKKLKNPPPSPAHSLPPTAIVDYSGELVSGELIEDSVEVTYPLYAGGVKIGELKSWPFIDTSRTLDSPLAIQFSRQQLWASLFIALFCLTVAGIISWLVADKLLKPIRLVLKSVSQLSEGQYKVVFTEKRTDEIGQLMGNIEALSITLDKTRTAKNRWFANISHELRTPLTVLKGEIEVLKAGIRPLNMEQLDSFEQEVNLLGRLIEDLYQLSLSDIGGLKYNLTTLDYYAAVQGAITSAQPLAQSKGIQLTTSISDGAVITGDKQRIEQLLSNLINNSLNYTDSPGRLDIKLDKVIDEIEGKKVRLTLNDTVPGLSKDECENIFEPLYRHDSSRKMRESGAGLGLSICSNIVDAHQGKIYAAPSSLGGVCIIVEFNLISSEN